MGHLFHSEFSAAVGSSISSSSDPDLALFTNIQLGAYWSSTVYAANSDYAWRFGFHDGYQGPIGKAAPSFAWAVRTGDVATVPLPAAVWLFGSGLLGLIGMARRKTA